MSIKPICDFCNQELKEFGATLYSPPDAHGMNCKSHVCVTCYDELIQNVHR